MAPEFFRDMGGKRGEKQEGILYGEFIACISLASFGSKLVISLTSSINAAIAV
jgi:hypothetical protein